MTENSFDLINLWALAILKRDFNYGDVNIHDESLGMTMELKHCLYLQHAAREAVLMGGQEERLAANPELGQYALLHVCQNYAAGAGVSLRRYCEDNGLHLPPEPDDIDQLQRPLLPYGMYYFNPHDYENPLFNQLQTNDGCV